MDAGDDFADVVMEDDGEMLVEVGGLVRYNAADVTLLRCGRNYAERSKWSRSRLRELEEELGSRVGTEGSMELFKLTWDGQELARGDMLCVLAGVLGGAVVDEEFGRMTEQFDVQGTTFGPKQGGGGCQEGGAAGEG